MTTITLVDVAQRDAFATGLLAVALSVTYSAWVLISELQSRRKRVAYARHAAKRPSRAPRVNITNRKDAH
jgi:hypothetical protein